MNQNSLGAIAYLFKTKKPQAIALGALCWFVYVAPEIARVTEDGQIERQEIIDLSIGAGQALVGVWLFTLPAPKD